MQFTCFKWIGRQHNPVAVDAPDAATAACTFGKDLPDGEHVVIVKGAGPFLVTVGHGHVEATAGLPPA